MEPRLNWFHQSTEPTCLLKRVISDSLAWVKGLVAPLCGQTHHVKGQIGWTPSFPIADDNVDSGGLDPIGLVKVLS